MNYHQNNYLVSRIGTTLVTGGAGFIGSNFINFLLANKDNYVVNIDKLTYAGFLPANSQIF